MLNLNKIRLAVLSTLLLPALALAAEPVAITEMAKPVNPAIQADSAQPVKQKPSLINNASAQEIAASNERQAVMSAQLAELEMRLKIVEKNAEIRKATNPSTGAYGSENFVPSVAYIDGVDGKLKASLYVEGGNTQSVRVGDTVANWKVKDIKMDSVTVQKGKELIRLGFGSYSSNPTQANQTNGQNLPVGAAVPNGTLMPGQY